MSHQSSMPGSKSTKSISPVRQCSPHLTPSHDKPRSNASNGQAFLDIPVDPSFRPSIDSYSDFSTDSVRFSASDEGQSPRPMVHGGSRMHSRSPAPRSTWRHSVHESWARNKGLILVILAQLFGALMSVTTRLLETDGSHGKGMHPFQVILSILQMETKPLPIRLRRFYSYV